MIASNLVLHCAKNGNCYLAKEGQLLVLLLFVVLLGIAVNVAFDSFFGGKR